MSRISSMKATFFYKRIFPFLWFGGLLLIVALDCSHHRAIAKLPISRF